MTDFPGKSVRCWIGIAGLIASGGVTPAPAQSVDAYGYDSSGRYHTDNYGSSRNLNLNTNVDVSAAKAQLARSFESLSRSPRPWYDAQSTRLPDAPQPQKSRSQIYWENLNAQANSGSIDSITEIAHEELYFRKNYPQAVKWLQIGADRGRNDLRSLLYRLLVDPTKGVRDLRRAAALLPPLAAIDPAYKEPWGQALIAGDYLPQDAERGRALREEAAAYSRKMGITGNLLALGHDYATGEGGMPQDTAQAIACYDAGVGDKEDYHGPQPITEFYLLVMAQPDAVQRYRGEMAHLLSVSLATYNADRIKALTTRIMGTIAPGEPMPEDPRTVAGLYLLDPRCGPPRYASARFEFDLSTDALAKRQLGLLWENEEAGTPDYALAADNFEQAGDAVSQRELALLYYRGLGRPKNREKALALLEQAAPKDPTGQCYYYLADDSARQYAARLRQPQGPDHPSLASLADDSQRNAANGARYGEPRAKSLWARWLRQNARQPSNSEEDREKIYAQVRELWTSADAGHVPEAAYYLGLMDREGQGGPKSEEKAWSEFRRSSEAGYPPAQALVGEAMATGMHGFAMDLIGAEALLTKAAPFDAVAANSLGVLVYHGAKGSERATEARQWFEKSFGQGYWPAGRNLAKFSHLGIGGPKDEEQARSYLEAAAKRGGKAGAQMAAQAYTAGEIIAPDPAAAARWQETSLRE